MRAAVDHVQHRHGQRRARPRRRGSGRAAAPSPPRPPSRPRARRRGSRWRRAGPCSACRRARSAAGRARPGRARPGPRPRPGSRRRWRPPCETPLPPHSEPPSRSSTASCTPVEAPEGTAARPNAPDSSSTSTSTVGLPRESRIQRPRTSLIELIAAPPWPDRSTGPARRAAARSSARPRAAASSSARSTRATKRAFVERSASSGSTFSLRREVDDGEEEVADLVRDARVGLGLGARLAGARDLRLQLAELLAHLRERPFEVGPVEPGRDRAALQLPRLQQPRQRRGHVVEDAGAALLLRLHLLPALADAAGRLAPRRPRTRADAA